LPTCKSVGRENVTFPDESDIISMETDMQEEMRDLHNSLGWTFQQDMEYIGAIRESSGEEMDDLLHH
jgi:hypothetical protein